MNSLSEAGLSSESGLHSGPPQIGSEPDPAPGAGADAPDADLGHFVEQVEQTFKPDALESFWSLEEEFRRLVHSRCPTAFFNRELRRLAGNPSFMGNWRPNQMMLHRGPGYALSIGLFDKPRQYIHSSPFYGMYAPLGQESLYYDIYKLPQTYRNGVFDPSVRLEPAGSGITAPGGILLLQTDQYVYDFRIERPLPVLKFITAPYQTMEWLFSKEQLHAWQANDSELVSTQLRVSAYILGRLAHASSLEALEQLSTHGHHAVRWAAVQNIGRLSRSVALTKLEQALDDPHPHVRRAAAKTLRQLKAKIPG
jgi:hypothetical protein